MGSPYCRSWTLKCPFPEDHSISKAEWLTNFEVTSLKCQKNRYTFQCGIRPMSFLEVYEKNMWLVLSTWPCLSTFSGNLSRFLHKIDYRAEKFNSKQKKTCTTFRRFDSLFGNGDPFRKVSFNMTTYGGKRGPSGMICYTFVTVS